MLHEQAKLVLKAKHGMLEHVLDVNEAHDDELVGEELAPLSDDSDELVQGVEEGSRIGGVGPDCVVGGEVWRDSTV